MSPCPLLVAAPVHHRAWIMDDWFDALEAQEPPDGTRLLFAVSEADDPTIHVILRRAPTAEIIVADGLPAFGDDERDDNRRFVVLAHIRNKLLRIAHLIQPDHYLSLDSDILLEPGALAAMGGMHKDAVGALIDMGGDVHPGEWSWMTLDDDFAYRPMAAQTWLSPEAGAFEVGVIMACKLMSPRAYMNTRYADHILGEDVAWSLSAERMGVERWICPQARGRHVYRCSDSPMPCSRS